MKRYIYVLMIIFTLLVAGCGGENKDDGKKSADSNLIAVSLPVKFPERWIIDGEELQKNLQAKGYDVKLEYASENSERQIFFLDKAIKEGAKCLIIAPVDAKALTKICEQAKEKDIKVISYDRFIMDTEAVDAYITFDNTEVGKLMGDYVADILRLDRRADAVNIEFFAGAQEDNNALMVYNGYMSVLKPFIDKGIVHTPSKEVAFNQVTTEKWMPEVAERRMDRLLKEYYTREKLNAVLAPNDLLANAIISSLTNSGVKVNYPVITGQDADKVAVINILGGKQKATVFKDTRILAKQCVDLADKMLKGEKIEYDMSKSYNNNRKDVPTILIEPVLVTADNAISVLVDSGYYKKVELGLE